MQSKPSHLNEPHQGFFATMKVLFLLLKCLLNEFKNKCCTVCEKLKFLAKIESNIKIKTNLKMQHYNNPDTNVFDWRKRMLNEMFGGADPDRVCSD